MGGTTGERRRPARRGPAAAWTRRRARARGRLAAARARAGAADPVGSRGLLGLSCLCGLLGLLTITRIGADPLAIAGAGYLAAATGPLWVADRREQRLPNAWVLPGYAFAGVGLAWAALGMGRSPGEAVVTAGVTVTVFLALGAAGGVGLGDVKLAGVLALVLGGLHGAPAAATSFVVAFVAAGAVAFAAMAAGRDGWAGRIAFGPYLLCGFWVVLLLW